MTEQADVINPEGKFPKDFIHLYSAAKITNGCEGLIVFLHSCMIEVGFCPKDVDRSDADKCLPENWKDDGIYNILYYHKNIPDTVCRMTGIPLCSYLSIHGTLEDSETEENVYLKVKVCPIENLSDPSLLFPHPEDLSIFFKDNFCFPLLVLIENYTDFTPSFGLSGLVEEAKVFILQKLPVESVVSLSAVNKDFYNQANSSYLWKFLFFRDYGADKLADTPTSSEENWKEMYKGEYLKRKRQRKTFYPKYRPYHLPEIFPVASNYFGVNPRLGVDPRINLDPALQQAFPLLRSRFHPSNWFLPRSGYDRWFW